MMIWRVLLVTFALVVTIGVVRSLDRGADPIDTTCHGASKRFAPPSYAGGSTGFATPEEAARDGVRYLVSEDAATQASEEEWAALELRSAGPGSTFFFGTFEDLLPDADEGAFTIWVTETEAGGYLLHDAKVCLDGR